jgi:hypothetical protein
MAEIFAGGETRKLGLIPRSIPIGELPNAPHYTAKFTVVPRGNWQGLESDDEIRSFIERCPIPASDQNGIGACGAYACMTAIHHCRRKTGLPYEPLAAGRLYQRSGHGLDRGSQLSDNLKYAMDLGIPRFQDRRKELDYRSEWTETEEDEGQQFRIYGAVDCPSFELLASAIQGPCDAVEHGILCGANYDVDDSGLWIRRPRGSGGGHAQCTPAGGLCRRGDQWGLLTHGSWGTQFGYKGWYVVPEEYFTSTPFNDGWGIYAVAVPDGNTGRVAS